MKKSALLFALLISALAKAQTTDYRTTEDGINQLINNAGFLDQMSHMSNEQIATTTLDKLFDEFVPEYKGFKADVNNLNLNNIYFTPDAGGNYSPKQLAGGFGKLLGMKDEEVNAFQSIFDGNYQEVDIRTSSSQLGNSLYNRGKNEGVDYVVDKTNNFLQEQYGSNEGNSALINLGTGILGNVLFALTDDNDVSAEKERQYKAALAAERNKRDQEQEAQGDAFKKGVKLSADGWVKSTNMNHMGALADFSQAIRLLNTSYMGGPELVKAYYKRGQTKMYMNDHRGAIIDYYFALTTATKVLDKKWEPTPRVQDNVLREVGMENVDIFADKEIVDILMGRAYAKYQVRDFAGAIADCNKALSVYRVIDAKDADWKNHPNNFNPNDFTPQLHPLNYLIGLMAMINLAQGNITEAMKQFNYNISKITMANSMVSVGALPMSFTREMILVKCYAYYKQGKYDEAIELYNNIIANEQYITIKGGNVSTAYSGRGNMYLAKKDYAKALSDYNSALKIRPEESMYYVNRGNCMLLMNDKDGAAKDFAIAKDPAAIKAAVKEADLANPAKQVNSYAWYTDTITKLLLNKKDEGGLLKFFESALMAFPDTVWFANNFTSHIRTAKGSKDLVLEVSNKIKGNGLATNGLKALYYNLAGDNKQCLEYSFKALEAGWPFMNFQYTLYPDYENDPVFCKYATTFIKKEVDEKLPSQKQLWQDNLKDHLAKPTDPVLGPNYLLLAQDYYHLGDAANAILYCDKDISGEGKGKYNNAFSTMTVKTKIKSLLMLGNTKEAVREAKKYSKPQKHYAFSEDDMFLPFIKNIAADNCNYDK